MSSALSVSMNDNGAAVVAWQQLDGLYAARFNGSPGWDAPVLVATHATPFGPSLQTALGIDRNGNAVLLWPGSLEGSSGFYFSWLDVATGSWTAAAQIPGSDLPGALTAWRVATNAAGEAVLVWTLMPALASGDPHRIHAVRWRPPGNGQPGGWTARERIGEPGGAGPQLAVSMDESGAIHVAWCYSLQMADGSFGPDTVRGRLLPAFSRLAGRTDGHFCRYARCSRACWWWLAQPGGAQLRRGQTRTTTPSRPRSWPQTALGCARHHHQQ